MRVPWLKKAVPSAFAEINVDDADKLGINDGNMIKIVTRRGELVIRARVPRPKRFEPTALEGRVSLPRPGVVFVPFFDAAKLVNVLTVDAVDDMSKEPEYKICACRLERA